MKYNGRIVNILFFSCVLGAFVWLFRQYGGVLEADRIRFVIISFFLTLLFLNHSVLTGKEIIVPNNRMLIPVALLLLWMLAKSVFSAYHWHSVLTLGMAFSFSGIFIMLFNFGEDIVPPGLLPVAAFPAVIYALLQMKGIMPHGWWAVENMVSSTLVNSSHFAAFLNILFFLVLALSFRSGNRMFRILSILCGILLVFLIAATKSRAGIICFAAGLVFFTVVSLRNAMTSRKILLPVILLFVLAASFCMIKPQTKERFLKWKLEPASVTQRLQMWKTCGKMARYHPLGVGAGCFSTLYPVYRTHSDRFIVNYAHNEILQVFVELGIPGMALFLFLLFAFFREMKHSEYDHLKTGIAAGLVSVSLQSLVDFPLHVPVISLFLVLLASRLHLGNRGVALSKKCLLPINLVLLMTIVFFTSFLMAEIYQEKGDIAERNGWREAKPFYERAVSLNTLKADFPARLAYNNMLYGSFAGKESVRYRQEAVEYYKIAVKRNPYNSFYRYGLAILYKRDGNFEESRTAFEKAISLNPMYGPFYIVYGRFLADIGYPVEGAENIRRGFSLFHEAP